MAPCDADRGSVESDIGAPEAPACRIAAELQGRLAAERRALKAVRPSESDRCDAHAQAEEVRILRSRFGDASALVASLEAQVREFQERAERAEAGARRVRGQAQRAERERTDAESYAAQAHRETKRLAKELETVLAAGEKQREMCAATLESNERDKQAHAEASRRAREEAEQMVKHAKSDVQRLRDLANDLQGQLEEERERGDQLAEKLKQMTTKLVDLGERLEAKKERERTLEQQVLDLQKASSKQHKCKQCRQQQGAPEQRLLPPRLDALQTSSSDDSNELRASGSGKLLTPVNSISQLQDVRDERDALHALLVSSQKQCSELRADISKFKNKCRSMEASQSSCWHTCESDAASARSHPASARSHPDMQATMEHTWQRITHDMQEQLHATEGQLGLAQEQRKCAEQQRDLAEQKLDVEKQCKEEAEGLVHALESEIRILEGTIRNDQRRELYMVDDDDLTISNIKSVTPETTPLVTDDAGWPVWPACGEGDDEAGAERKSCGKDDFCEAGESPRGAQSEGKLAGGHGELCAKPGARGKMPGYGGPALLDEPEVEFEPDSSGQRGSCGEEYHLPPARHAASASAISSVSQCSQSDLAAADELAASAAPARSRANSHPLRMTPPEVPARSQQQRGPAPLHGASFDLPLSGNERDRLRKLAVENVALLDTNYKTRMLLDELTNRLRRMRDAAWERGQPKATFFAEIAETAGLGEVFGSAPRNVFERLYWDGLLRLRRLEEVTRKIHEEERSEMLQVAGSSDLGSRSAALARQTRAILARFDGQKTREGREGQADNRPHAHRDSAAAAASGRTSEAGGCGGAGETAAMPSPSQSSGGGVSNSGTVATHAKTIVSLPTVASPMLVPFSLPCAESRNLWPKRQQRPKKKTELLRSLPPIDRHSAATAAAVASPSSPPPMLVAAMRRCGSLGGHTATKGPGKTYDASKGGCEIAVCMLPAVSKSSLCKGGSLSAAHRHTRSVHLILR